MAQYLVKRVLGALPVFFGITLLVFFLMNMAPATIADLAGGEDASSAAARAALEANLGLDQPLPVRYVLWLKELLTGDLGLSYRTGQPVLGMIAQRVGPSLILTGTGVAAAVVIGIPLGVMAAWKPRSLWSRLAGGLTLLSFSAPGFFLCVLAIFFFSVVLGWLPAAGMYSAAGGGGLGDLLRHLVLPASVVCLSSLGNLVRQTASACGEVLGEDYIRTARAKGLPEWAVVWKHGFRTALLPVVTTILNHIPHIIGGSLVVERIFGWPGMGSLLFTSVSSRDYTVIMGLTVVIALTVLATGILMDLVYRLVDPGVGWGGEATAFLLVGLLVGPPGGGSRGVSAGGNSAGAAAAPLSGPGPQCDRSNRRLLGAAQPGAPAGYRRGRAGPFGPAAGGGTGLPAGGICLRRPGRGAGGPPWAAGRL